MEDAQVGWIAAIIIGGLAGWFASMFMKSDTGIFLNIVLGIVGIFLPFLWLIGAILPAKRGSRYEVDQRMRQQVAMDQMTR